MTGSGQLSLMATAGALAWATFARGADEHLLWAAVPFWMLAFAAGWLGAGDRLQMRRAGHRRPSGLLWPGALFAAFLTWSSLVTVGDSDPFQVGLRLLSYGATMALGSAVLRVMGDSKRIRGGIRDGIVFLVSVQALLALFLPTQGAGTLPRSADVLGLLALGIPLTLSLLLRSGWDRSQGGWLLGAMLLQGAALLALPHDLAPWVGLLVLGVVLVGECLARRSLCRGGLTILVLMGLVAWGAGAAGGRRLSPTTLSTLWAERGEVRSAVDELLAETSLAGEGLGNFTRAFGAVRPAGMIELPRDCRNGLQLVQVEGGLVGLGLFSVFLLSLLVSMVREWWREPAGRPEGRKEDLLAVLAGWIGVGLLDQFEVALRTPLLPALLAVLCAMAMAPSVRGSERDWPPEPVPWPALVGILVGMTWLGVLGHRLLRWEIVLVQAEAALAREEARDALGFLDEALRWLPGIGRTHLLRAEAGRLRALETVGEESFRSWAQVEKDVRRAAELEGRSGRGLVLLAEAVRARGQDEWAHAILLEAVELARNDPQVLFPTARSYLQLGEVATCQALFGLAFGFAPVSERPLEEVRRTAALAEDPSWLVEALPVDCPEGLALVAQELQQRGRWEEANRIWEGILAGGRGAPALLRGRGLSLLSQGRWDEALGCWEGLDGDLLDREVRGGRIQCLRILGRDQQALEEARQAREQWGDEFRWENDVAELLLQVGDEEAAREAFRKLGERWGDRPEGPGGEGRVLERRGRRSMSLEVLRMAAALYREALERDPDRHSIARRLARIYLDLGDASRGRRLLEKLREEGELGDWERLLLGKVYLEEGSIGEALPLLEEASRAAVEPYLGGRPAHEWLEEARSLGGAQGAPGGP